MKKIYLVALSLVMTAAGCWNLNHQPSNQNPHVPVVVSKGREAVPQIENQPKGLDFACRQMQLTVSIPPGLHAGYFANSQSNRPMISIGDDQGEKAGIVWFKDTCWKRNALQFVKDWVLRDNTTDRPVRLDNELARSLNAHRQSEYWQVDTDLGIAVLLVTKTKTEDSENLIHGAYLLHHGSILWIYSQDSVLFARILSTMKEAK